MRVLERSNGGLSLGIGECMNNHTLHRVSFIEYH